ncbi:TonB-dependent receptor [Sphingosinicella sp. YJ22]|uniref:TonB-dependent receptor n=1 Tax=Sphingosinicella sp. YJ22 TaxID=1104780 RepID=UPI00140D5A39|nr:TonB-dependent receptor [Sphingosinicella sp. YJ22]
MRSLLLLSAAFVAVPAQAQDAPPADDQRPAADHVHEEIGAEVVVTAPFVSNLNILAGTSALTGNDLAREIRPQLGDTLARLPGVSATSFSPGSSRPVLRGFQGERVRVLVDGIGSIDVSNTSADHAVTIDPITAERIEVLHGPAVLLFGSQAIGGAVNIFDRRIPRTVPDDIVHIDGLASYGSAANERSVGAGVDFALGGGVVGHVDGSYRRTDDLDVGGFVLAPTLRAEQLAIADEEEDEGHLEEAAEARALAGVRGTLPNSATETTTGGVGVALIREGGSLGLSLSLFDSRYGVPLRPGAGHHHDEGDGEGEGEGEEEHGEAPVSIDLRQIRADLRGEVKLGAGFFEQLRVRFAAADYEHTEFEGDEVGTLFETQGMEGRAELVQKDRGGWRGVIGGQFFVRDFDAVGAEAFLPANSTSQIGLFALQEFEFGPVQLEGALRYEHAGVASAPLGIDRSFDSFSAAAGASYEIVPRVRAGINLSRAERAPSAEELFSSGPHVATQAFEIGDPTFSTESNVGGELYLRASLPGFQINGTLFYNRFDNYIFAAATGAEQDELPVFQYFQRDATYWGFEFGANAQVARVGDWRVSVDGVADYVEATIADGDGPVPRIPPLRVLGGIEAANEMFEGRVEAEHVFEQDRIAAFETATEAFTLVNVSLTIRPFGRENPTALILSANNILDVEARRHASFTKDFVPLAGRDLRATVRVSF